MSANPTRTSCLLAVISIALAACSGPESASPGQPAPSATTSRWHGPAELPTRPAAYVDGLVEAWAHQDRAEIERYAAPGVTDSLLALDATPGTGGARCFTHAGATACEVVTADLRSLELTVDRARVRSGSEDAVRAVQLLGAVPTTDQAYVDGLVAAWRTGDRPAALRYAVPAAVDALWAHGWGDGWTQTSLEAALGARFAFYEDADGDLLVLKFNISTVSSGQTQAITSAEFPRRGDPGYNWD